MPPAKKVGYEVGYEVGSPELSLPVVDPRLRQATADHHALSALSPNQLANARRKAEEETKLVKIKVEETKLTTLPQLRPYVTPKKFGYEVGCEVGTWEAGPWPDPIPPSRTLRHSDTSAPLRVPPAKKVGCEVGYEIASPKLSSPGHREEVRLPYVTPKKVGYKVGCEIGTSEPKPWPDPLPPSKPPRHLGTSAPQHRRQCPPPRRSASRLATRSAPLSSPRQILS